MDALPELPAHYPDSFEVSVILRQIHRTAKAVKVAADAMGPVAGRPFAWLPLSQVLHVTPRGYDGSGSFVMKARTYRRLREELTPPALAARNA